MYVAPDLASGAKMDDMLRSRPEFHHGPFQASVTIADFEQKPRAAGQGQGLMN